MSSEPPSLMDSSRAVLRLLASHGPVTRPRLGQLLDLSKPTMSAAVAELDALGLVALRGLEKGALGRTAKVYGLGPAAGFVIGVDVGASHVRAVAHTLDGQEIASDQRPVRSDRAPAGSEVGGVILSAVRSVATSATSERGPLRSIAVAVPRIVDGRPSSLGRPDGPEVPLLALRTELEVPILIENNVNCAALGELHFGVARERATFAYLQVGVRIGMGLVIGGRLFRGNRGGAGEVGRVPFPWTPSETPVREGLEHHLGSEALMQRCRADWPTTAGPAPETAKGLFTLAEAGSRPARLWVSRHARDVGRLVATCVGMLDPGLIVLGGGVGQNPLIVAEVAEVSEALTWPTEVAVSSLGDRGTVLGAMRLAADHSLGGLLGEDGHPAVVLPALPRQGPKPARVAKATRARAPGVRPPSATRA